MNRGNYLHIYSVVNAGIADVKKKMKKYQDLIKERQALSKKNYPGKNVVEMETIEDWVDMAALAGELKALRRVKRLL